MKAAKWILIVMFTMITAVYLAVYLALPYFLNKYDYSKLLSDAIKNKTGLIVNIHDYKLNVSPALNINFKAGEIQAFYPDKKQFLDIKKADITISTIYLLKKEIRLNRVKAGEFQLSTKLLKNGKTTLLQYFEQNIKQADFDYKFSKKHPNIYADKYIIKLKDEESGQKFKLKGKDFKSRQSIDLKNIVIESSGDMFCFDRKYLGYKARVTVPVVLLENSEKTLIDFTVDDLYKYNFSANVNTDIKIHARDKKFDYITGRTDIDNFRLKLGAKTLPPSFFHIVFAKDKAKLVSKFYTDINELTDINADIKLSKPYKIYMTCRCPKADISNLQNTIVPVLNLFKIKNNLSEFKTQGKLSADFKLQTDLKTISSNGTLNITNASISHKSIPLKITGVNAVVDFSDNAINIKKSDILVNSQPLKITGSVDKHAAADITVSAQNLALNHIINAFPVLKPDKNITLGSGSVSLNANFKGKLNSLKPVIKISVKNLAGAQTAKKIKFSVKELVFDVSAEKSNAAAKYNGIIEVKDVICSSTTLPAGTDTIKSDLLSAKITNDVIQLLPAKINAGKAKLTVSGDIKNYMKSPEANINIAGTIDSLFVKSLIPSGENLLAKGYLPLKTTIKTKNKKADIDLKVLANPQNYITPVKVKSFDSTTTLTTLRASISDNLLTLDDATMYYAGSTNSLLKDIDTTNLKKAINIKGKIKDLSSTPVIEKLHISTPTALTLNIPQTKDGTLNLTANITAAGKIDKLSADGNISAADISIPSMYVSAQNAQIILNNNIITVKTDDLRIKDTNLAIEASAKPDILTSNKIDYLKLTASYIDMDYLTGLLSLFNPSKYAPGNDFPYIISSGNLDIKSFKMGVIKAQNITAKITSQKNNLYISDLFADAYGGKAAAKIVYNFPYTNIKADVQARGLNAASAAAAFMPADKGISGTLDFDASVNMMGTTPQQQLNTMKGSADVLIKNGRLGQLGRFEHFLYAQNLLSQKLIYASLNSAKQAISPQDTGMISYLKAKVKFGAGYAHLNPVLTSGPRMSMYIKGKINLVTQDVDLKILGKISSDVSGSLGLLGSMTIKDFLDEHTKYGPVIANLFDSYNTELPETDISTIPALSPAGSAQTKNFQVIISGDPDSVKAVKSFTWVNPTGTKEKILTQKVKKAISEALPSKTSQDTQPVLPKPQPQIQTAPQTAVPDFLDKIPDEFKKSEKNS